MEGSCVERYVLSGRIEGVDPSTMTVVVNGTVVAGTIRTPRAVYRIRSDGGGVHVVSQIDESRLPPGAEPLRPPPADVAGTADAVDIPGQRRTATPDAGGDGGDGVYGIGLPPISIWIG